MNEVKKVKVAIATESKSPTMRSISPFSNCAHNLTSKLSTKTLPTVIKKAMAANQFKPNQTGAVNIKRDRGEKVVVSGLNNVTHNSNFDLLGILD